jgi:trk system potassium uptake protein TrkH
MLIIELVGALILFGVWDQGVKFSGNADKLFDSLYHAVSAISNCGLSTFENGLKTTSTLRHNYLAHWILMLLAFIGSIGFIVVLDLFSRKSIKARLAKTKLRITKASQWILYGSCALIGIGAVVFFLTERNAAGLAEHQNIFGGVTTSLFQSVMAGSGFATVTWSKSWWFVLGFLFIIGGSMVGSRGGIRIENIAHIISPAAKLGFGSLKKMSVLFVLWNISAIGLLYFSETHILNDPRWGLDTLIFEQLSAFCNAGHSAGVTSQLSLTGQIIIILTMFVGRVSLLYIIGRSLVKSVNQKLPQHESSFNN